MPLVTITWQAPCAGPCSERFLVLGRSHCTKTEVGPPAGPSDSQPREWSAGEASTLPGPQGWDGLGPIRPELWPSAVTPGRFSSSWWTDGTWFRDWF